VADSDDGYTLLFDVWVVANSTRALLDRALRPSGLSAEDFALYSAIRRDGGVTPTELSSLMALPPTTVSSIITRIERRGHLRRAPNPADARSYRIRLSASGQAAHAAAGEQFTRVLGRVEAALSIPPGHARDVLAAINSAVLRATGGMPGPPRESQAPRQRGLE
jgi:DNA-binding MarR family transcriptional regulator